MTSPRVTSYRRVNEGIHFHISDSSMLRGTIRYQARFPLSWDHRRKCSWEDICKVSVSNTDVPELGFGMLYTSPKKVTKSYSHLMPTVSFSPSP